jgi:hypothetical protein
MEVLSPVVLPEETETLGFALHCIRLLLSPRLGSSDSGQRTRGKYILCLVAGGVRGNEK